MNIVSSRVRAEWQPPSHVERLKILRSHYDKDNHIGKLLDELIKDVSVETPRKKVKTDCRKILKELDDDTSAARAIREYLEMKPKSNTE